MTRFMLAFALLVASALPAAAAERRYPVTDFDRVVVEGPYVVRLTTGRPSAATATGSQAALDRLSIDVSGQTLRIRRNRSYWGGNTGAQEGPVTLELSTRSLRSARLIGPASFEVDRVEGMRVDLTVEGSGRLRAGGVAADTLTLGLAGSGRLELAGRARSLRADSQGSGDIEASGLRAEDAIVTTASLGSVTVAVGRAATVNALGLGPVTVLGRPACTVRGPGAAEVRCGSRLDQRQYR